MKPLINIEAQMAGVINKAIHANKGGITRHK
jgi:hypothetical protein